MTDDQIANHGENSGELMVANVSSHVRQEVMPNNNDNVNVNVKNLMQVEMAESEEKKETINAAVRGPELLDQQVEPVVSGLDRLALADGHDMVPPANDVKKKGEKRGVKFNMEESSREELEVGRIPPPGPRLRSRVAPVYDAQYLHRGGNPKSLRVVAADHAAKEKSLTDEQQNFILLEDSADICHSPEICDLRDEGCDCHEVRGLDGEPEPPVRINADGVPLALLVQHSKHPVNINSSVRANERLQNQHAEQQQQINLRHSSSEEQHQNNLGYYYYSDSGIDDPGNLDYDSVVRRRVKRKDPIIRGAADYHNAIDFRRSRFAVVGSENSSRNFSANDSKNSFASAMNPCSEGMLDERAAGKITSPTAIRYPPYYDSESDVVVVHNDGDSYLINDGDSLRILIDDIEVRDAAVPQEEVNGMIGSHDSLQIPAGGPYNDKLAEERVGDTRQIGGDRKVLLDLESSEKGEEEVDLVQSGRRSEVQGGDDHDLRGRTYIFAENAADHNGLSHPPNNPPHLSRVEAVEPVGEVVKLRSAEGPPVLPAKEGNNPEMMPVAAMATMANPPGVRNNVARHNASHTRLSLVSFINTRNRQQFAGADHQFLRQEGMELSTSNGLQATVTATNSRNNSKKEDSSKKEESGEQELEGSGSGVSGRVVGLGESGPAHLRGEDRVVTKTSLRKLEKKRQLKEELLTNEKRLLVVGRAKQEEELKVMANIMPDNRNQILPEKFSDGNLTNSPQKLLGLGKSGLVSSSSSSESASGSLQDFVHISAMTARFGPRVQQTSVLPKKNRSQKVRKTRNRKKRNLETEVAEEVVDKSEVLGRDSNNNSANLIMDDGRRVGTDNFFGQVRDSDDHHSASDGSSSIRGRRKREKRKRREVSSSSEKESSQSLNYSGSDNPSNDVNVIEQANRVVDMTLNVLPEERNSYSNHHISFNVQFLQHHY